ncbi:hypothetical protein Tco_0683272 [Tanacetum coccineum]|uniref:Uncharacterized protein n=1 Tax=Tanacetum coccineum TaxID=301880 RepID=A0ABQ4XUP9_9ASTR
MKNPVYNSKTKEIEIRHHFIQDCYEKKLIRVEKIHTDLNVADLLTKPFDGPRFNFLMHVFLCFRQILAGIAWICRCKEGVIRYALTTNLTIYDSLVKQFWQTATAKTLADGTLELQATIDTIVVKILEVALKRKTKRILLSDSEEEETEAQGRKFHDLDPLVSLLQELVTPSKTVNASGEEQVEDISPTTLEAAAILTKVKKIKSVDKGKRYKRRKVSKESAGTGLDFEEVKSAFEEVNTGSIKVSTGIEEINAGSLDVNTGSDPVTTDSIRVSVPSPDRGRREGKAPMTEEETQASKKTKEQILQEEAGLAEAIRLDALEKALEKE